MTDSIQQLLRRTYRCCRVGGVAVGSLIAISAVSLAASAETPPGWRLVWADEFDERGAPNPEIWGYEEGFVRNEELQYWTKSPRNVRVRNGLLILEARRQRVPNPQYQEGSDDWRRNRKASKYTSASINTKHKRPFLYGRVEIRARLPEGRGVWPALWTLGENVDTDGWPLCGEIDILEHVGHEPGRIHGSFHTVSDNHMNDGDLTGSLVDDDISQEFHVYSVEWDPDYIAIQFDGKTYSDYRKPENATVEQWPFDAPQYLILNLAVGGSWGGQKGVDSRAFPQRLEIDYVRVYERE